MLLDRTISQLDIGPMPSERAVELGQLGYMQWLGALPGSVSYPLAAHRALARARPFAANSPAVAVFCDLLARSLKTPALDLALPPKQRRGGARARRGAF